MGWKYYRNGELRAECNDIPETIEDAVIELQANGHDVSDCIIDNNEEPCDETGVCNTYAETEDCNCDDFWSPDYPPYNPEEDDLTFQPLNDEEMIKYKECIALLTDSPIKTKDTFMDKLHDKIKPSRLTRFKSWCKEWTDEEVSYLIFWIITIYVMIGVIKYEPNMLSIILWPFI